MEVKVKSQINPNIDIELKKTLVLYAQKKRVPYSEVVEAALNDYFDPDNEERRQAIVFRRLDALTRKIDNLSLDNNILSEAFALFIRNYLARLPDVPSEQAQTFVSRKEKNFNEFLSALSDSLEQGNSLINRLPRDSFISPEDGEALLSSVFEAQSQ